MVKRLAAQVGGLDKNAQVINKLRLAGKLFYRLRANAILVFPLLRVQVISRAHVGSFHGCEGRKLLKDLITQ